MNRRSKRYNKRYKTPKQRLLPILKMLPFFLGLMLLVWGVFKAQDSVLAIDIEWQIDPNLPISQTHLEQILDPLITNKYQLDLHKIKQTLEYEPWVAQAQVKRLFWNSIQINVSSHTIAMRWKNTHCDDQDSINCLGYISDKGVLFTPKKRVTSEAVIAHSENNQNIADELYKSYLLYQDLSSPMKITSFSKSQIDQITFEPNITVVLGYQQRQKRLKRFLKAYDKLKPLKKSKQVTFDMRYPKGFSLHYLR